jgi:hypothetical protein
MTIEQFRPESSSRGNVLFDALESHINDGDRILDIGCAYSCMAGLIRNEFPKCQLFGFDSNMAIMSELKDTHPYYRWERILIKAGDELKDYIVTSPDVIIHIGIDASWSDIWKVHPWLIKNYKPRMAMLETGRMGGYEVAIEQMAKVVKAYLDAGYTMTEEGQFDFDYNGDCLEDRHYRILTI